MSREKEPVVEVPDRHGTRRKLDVGWFEVARWLVGLLGTAAISASVAYGVWIRQSVDVQATKEAVARIVQENTRQGQIVADNSSKIAVLQSKVDDIKSNTERILNRMDRLDK